MSVSPGTRLGVYEVVSLIGAGGMGEVYCARDTKLNRDVAVKILPDLLAGDPDRLARFRREAQIVASLNHPNIAHVYGLEDAPAAGAAPVQALVMELVEGATLADRIAEGPLAIGDALAIAAQVADALEAAHEQGVVHRDLKPANIKVRADGVVKVLDFGLAKMLDTGAVASGSSANLSMSPTLSVHATFSGTILGTAAYMSPEQARGRLVDRRTDVWAFGCVLFEMLCGARAFDGEDIAETIGAVIHKEPAWEKLPAATPATVRLVLRRCLEKDPKRRLRDIGDVQLALDGAFETAPPPVAAAAPVPPSRKARSLALGAVAGAAIAAAVVAATALWLLRPAATPRRPMRFTIAPPASQPLNLQGFFRQIAISPDGSRIAYIAGAESQLMVRAIDQLEAVPLRGATDAAFPFFSPDGKWIGYMSFGPGEIRKVALTGGPPIRICGYTNTPRGAVWGPDDTIVYGTNDTTTGLVSVPAGGGESKVLTKPDRTQGELGHWMPSLSPDGRVVFFTISSANGPENGQIAALDLQTGSRKTIVRGGTDAVYVDTSAGGAGHLIYASTGTLRAVRFDFRRMTVIGEPMPVVDQVAVMPTGAADFSVSRDGTLIYVPGGSSTVVRPLVWVSRDGHQELVNAPARAYTFARLSPDETRVALAATDQQNDVWIFDRRRGTMTRLTSDPTVDNQPLWSPDGRRIVFVSARAGIPNLYSQAADGTGAVERLTTRPTPEAIGSFAPDGRSLVFQEGGPVTGSGSADLMLLRFDSPLRTEPLLRTPFFEAAADISPDGRWLAYYSTESGRAEVYVRPFPNVSARRWQISAAGGSRPAWSKSGKELFYLDGTTAMMAVPVQTGTTFSPGTPVQLFPGPWYSVQSVRPYDVTHDGKFLMIKNPGSDDPRLVSPTITVVAGWTDELKTRVPAK